MAVFERARLALLLFFLRSWLVYGLIVAANIFAKVTYYTNSISTYIYIEIDSSILHVTFPPSLSSPTCLAQKNLILF